MFKIWISLELDHSSVYQAKAHFYEPLKLPEK